MTKTSNDVPIVDVDNPTTWPTPIYKTISEWAERCNGATNYTVDLPLSLDDEKPFRELFAGYLLRAYHYTRLLKHERAMVLSMGLCPLSAELLSDRIESACKVGAISGAEAAEFHQAHVFANGEQQGREGQVCLSLSRRVFERDMEACRPLLETWGGEGMYRSSGAASQRERLKTLGSPTIVVALIEFGDSASNHLVFPALHKVFVGAFLGLFDVGADVFYRAAVPPKHIESVDEVALH